MTTTAPPPATIERIGHVALITLNRPEAMNAVNAAMSIAVGEAIDQLMNDPELRVGVITGAGRAFCAGADLKEVAAKRSLLGPNQLERGFGGFLKGFVDKPLIAAVNGYALGGGTEILLACDLAVMSDRATLGLPEVTRGIIAAGGGMFRLPMHVPRKIALEMVLTGAPIDAASALSWGLVNRVVAADQVLDTAMELAVTIAANAPLAVQASKRVVHSALARGSDWDPDVWQLTDRELGRLFKSEDAKEGPRAFAAKRAPQWTGR